LTHLQPGTDPVASRDAARRSFDRGIEVAGPGVVVEVPGA
jgi:hypothetical protein